MKRIYKAAVILLIAVTLSVLSVALAYAEKTATCTRGDVQIILGEDGSAEITETWVCDFGDGDFSRYGRSYYTSEAYQLYDFSSMLDGSKLKQLPEADASRPEGFFAVTEHTDETVIDVYHRSKDESRTFTLCYKVRNAVILHDDIAEFKWDISGKNEISEIGTLTAAIILPQEVAQEDYKIWAHGPLNGTFVKSDDNRALLSVTAVPVGTPVDIRMAMPRELFSKDMRYEAGEALSGILMEEQDVADSVNVSWKPLLGIPVMVAALLLILQKMKKKRVKQGWNHKNSVFKPRVMPAYYPTLPSELSPALASKLLFFYEEAGISSERINSSEQSFRRFSATLLDLSQRGFLSLRPFGDDTEIIIMTDDDLSSLHSFEQLLLDILSTVAQEGEALTMGKLTDYITAHPQEMKQKMAAFQTAITEGFETLGLVESHSWAVSRTRKTLGIVTGGALGIVVMGISGAFFVITDQWIGFTILLPIIFGIVGFCFPYAVLTAPRPYLTQEGENALALWAAFRRFLDDFGSFTDKDLPEFAVRKQYLSYGAVMGNNRKLLESLTVKYPQSNNWNFDDWIFYEQFERFQEAALATGRHTPPGEHSYNSGSGDGGGFSSLDGGSESGSSGSMID